jgi:hypothetical protein
MRGSSGKRILSNSKVNRPSASRFGPSFFPTQNHTHNIPCYINVAWWLEIRNPPELRWWFSIESLEGLEGLIDQSFSNKRDALVWLFLGTHQWFHEHTPRQRDSYKKDETKTCCHPHPGYKEWEYVASMIKSVSREDRV